MLIKSPFHDVLLETVKNNRLQHMQSKSEVKLNPLGYYLSDEAKKQIRWLYILYYEAGGNVSNASKRVGISRQWLSGIKSMFEKGGRDPRCIEPESRTPHNTDNRNRIPKEYQERIIAVRDEYQCWGKEKIQRVLKRDYNIVISSSTVNRYLHKEGKINPKISEKNKKAWEQKKQRDTIEAREPNLRVKYRPPSKIKDYKPGALVEKDMKFIVKQGIFLNQDKYKAKENFYYQHTEIDSFTRIKALEITNSALSEASKDAHQRSLKRFPFPIACVNTDNGSENGKAFSSELQKNNVMQFYSTVGTPTDNPRVERSHLTDEIEFYQQGNRGKELTDLQKAAKQWEHVYNYKRPHQALGYLTPIEFYQLWKKDPKAAHRISEQYRTYLEKQRKRLFNARRLKRKEQVNALMEFIDAKLTKNMSILQAKQQLINCQLCSWT